jgi:hypothetical protein
MQELMEGNKKMQDSIKATHTHTKDEFYKEREIGLDRIPHFVKQLSYKVK